MDQSSFTPLVFTVAGGVGGEGRGFYSRLTILLSLENEIEKLKWLVGYEVNEKLDIELEHTNIKKIIDQDCCINITFNCILDSVSFSTLHKKGSFPLRIS